MAREHRNLVRVDEWVAKRLSKPLERDSNPSKLWKVKGTIGMTLRGEMDGKFTSTRGTLHHLMSMSTLLNP